MNIEQLEAEMLSELKAIDSFLNKKVVTWENIRSSLNMVENRNRQHYPKLLRKLFMDYRMIGDHQISDPILDRHLERAYEIAKVWVSEK